MGILSWLTGKSSKQEEANPFPSDHVLAGKVASLIEFELFQDPGGLTRLLEPTCMVVLSKDGNVGLRWPSSPEDMQELVHDIVSFAFINDLPGFKNLVETLSSFSELDGSEALIKDWLKLMGPSEIDTIAAEALCEMKSKAAQRLAIAEKPLAPGRMNSSDV